MELHIQLLLVIVTYVFVENTRNLIAELFDEKGDDFKFAVQIILIAPITEELIFRLPLVFLGDKTAYSVLVSSILFSVSHISNHIRNLCYSNSKAQKEFEKANKVERRWKLTAINNCKTPEELSRKKQKRGRVGLIRQILATFILGIITGYLAITYKNILIPIVFHITWNTVTYVIAYIKHHYKLRIKKS